jgi:hypothetical protein
MVEDHAVTVLGNAMSLMTLALTLGRRERRRVCPRKRRKGVVLFLVTVAIIMLSLAGLSFVLTLTTEHKAIDAQGDELRLQQLLESGVELMGTFVEQSPETQRTAGGLNDNPALFRGALVFNDERAACHGRVTVVSPRLDNDEIVGVRYGLEDESGRLNLAVLPEWERQFPDAAKRVLMYLPGMTESAAAAILDWLGADRVSRSGGAKRDQYADLHLPYAPRNGIPARLEELLLARGMPRGLLLGRDLNLNYRLDPSENGGRADRAGSRFTGTPLPWAALLTLHSAERNVNPRGQPRVTLNDPDLRQLFTRLSAVIDPAWAEFIIRYRQFGPSPTNAPAADTAHSLVRSLTASTTSGRTAEDVVAELDFSRPGLFRVESILDLVGIRIVLSNPPTPEAQSVDSPFSVDRATMREYLPILLDETTVTPDKVLRGRVSVNTAPRAVLRGVPGMDDRLVEAVVANRRTAAKDSERRHAVWLLTEGLVEIPQMKTLLPYLTGGGQVYRAQVVGYFEEGGPIARAEVVLDAAVTPPRPVLWTDLRLRGRGFSREEL